jgi:hypothetical protein
MSTIGLEKSSIFVATIIRSQTLQCYLHMRANVPMKTESEFVERKFVGENSQHVLIY